jgi:hypothetical protein
MAFKFMSHSLYTNVLIYKLMFQTQRFGAYLLVKDVDSTFPFNPNKRMIIVGVDVVSNEWFQNFTTKKDQAMNGTRPWLGPREKSLGFWQMLIEASTLPSDIVLDYTAMTGKVSSIHYGF